MTYPLLVVSLLLLLCLTVESVDKSKFRTCRDTAFCKRNRIDNTQRINYNYFLNVSTVVADASTGLRGLLSSSSWPLQAPLSLSVSLVSSGIVRIRINEINPKSPRWEVHDVLLEAADKIYKTEWRVGQLGAIGMTKLPNGVPFEIHVQANPLVITTLLDGKIQMQANARNLLSFEQYRDKNPAPPPPSDPSLPSTDPSAPTDGAAAATDGAAVNPPLPETEQVIPVPPPPQVFPYDDHGMWNENWSSHVDSKPKGPASISMDVTFTARDVYGIPEHASSFSLKSTIGSGSSYGEPYRLFNLDVFEYELDVPMSLYGAVPFMMGHTKAGTAGMFWLNAAETFVDISDTVDVDGNPLKETHWISESGVIDLFLLPGPSPNDLWFQYATITGSQQLPPRFAIGYHQCRWNYRSEEDVAGVDAGFDANDIPYDVLWLDIEHTDGKKYFTWDKTHFPNPVEMQNSLAKKGRKMVTIVDPHIKRDSNYKVHNGATSSGLYVKNPLSKGGDYEGWCWPGSVSYLDFMEKSVRDYWADHFSLTNYEHSTDNLFIWNDMNEPSVFNGPEVTMPKDCLHHQGTVEHRDVHNQYGFYVQMASADGLIRRSSGSARPFVLTRSFFSGSQRYGAVWTGDNHASWAHLAVASPMLLSLGVAGITFSGADVGGFFGDPEVELLIRWYQAAAYQPFFRGHAHIDAKRREPWLFGEPATSHIRNAVRERYAILPYVYTAFYLSHKHGVPVLRPLWSEFSADTRTHSIDSTFLLGDSILVAPVTTANALSLLVYLPAGATWYDSRTYTPYVGGDNYNVAAPLSFIPVFYRGGSIIVKKNRPRRSSSSMAADPFTLVVSLQVTESSPLGAASGLLFDDDGYSFKYLEGSYLLQEFKFQNGELKANPATRPSGLSLAPYKLGVPVERIVILGWPSKVNSVVTNSGTSLEFIQDDRSVTIRKPNVSIDDSWSIRLA